MSTSSTSTKTKIAKRVIEVFEFFASGNTDAKVMDIVRQYDRPQSSTSELLTALREMGLLYKDPNTRTYSPTPRLAAIGYGTQGEMPNNGQLFAFMDRLSQSSGCTVILVGMVGTRAQIFRSVCKHGKTNLAYAAGVSIGLASSTVGRLLLSALGPEQANRMLWRLHAEAAVSERFDLAEARRQVEDLGRLEASFGPSGFAPGLYEAAVLLPEAKGDRSLAIGVSFSELSEAEALLSTLEHGISKLIAPDEGFEISFLREVPE